MEALDHRKLLDNDPQMTAAFLACIRRYVRRFFVRDSQVHDVTQATMIDILDKLGDGIEPKPGGVHRWVLNCASNVVRRELTRVRREVVSYQSQLHGWPAPSTSAIVSARQELLRIDELLRTCSEITREVLLSTAEGGTHREVAEDVGSSPGAVRTTLTRARAQLREATTAQERLNYLRWLAKHAGHGQPSLFKTPRPGSNH